MSNMIMQEKSKLDDNDNSVFESLYNLSKVTKEKK